MNHIYRSIWNDALGTWVAVSEIAQGSGKRSSNRRKLMVTSLLVCTTSAWALPTGEQLMAGQASVSVPTANQMQIQQTSQKAILNWQGFSIAPNEAVNIQQPNARAALLNRVVGQDASQIQGQLNANGQVYLTNPNGVIFGKTAQVDVGGLIATTHNISNADFMHGNNHFTQNSAKGSVENHGTINTHEGGVVALIGESVTNTGTIDTPKGSTVLAAGKTVDLDFKCDGLVEVKVSEAALNAQITNKGAIQADGGRVILTAKAAGQLIDTVINQEGIIRAQGLAEHNGEIVLEAGYVAQTGTLDVSGKNGGKVDINARSILDAGKTNADGTNGQGGKISLLASDAIIQTATADTHANGKTGGGEIRLEAADSVYSSGKLSATGEKGGNIDVVSSNSVVLAAAAVDASGIEKGGLIRIGGDFHGAKTKLSSSAKTTTVNGATKLKADGGDGKVVVWSDEKTDYYGSISANKKGNIEVSSKGTLTYAGSADAGMGGELLLDPKNIIISSKGGAASYALIDPHLAADNQFGLHTALLGTTVNGVFTDNGNVAVSSPFDDFAASNAGAVYLFNTTTGSLLAALTGSHVSDNVGLNGITALNNGNYVVSSINWDNGIISDAGAATWGNGTTGISGIVNSANSLTGSTANDNVSNRGITALTNGNYVVASTNWDNNIIVDAGAATWGNGTTGTSGLVNAANSLVGSTTQDAVSSSGITALSNGNYVVGSNQWSLNSGSVFSGVGAATWGNGNGGTVGAINSANSLTGSIPGDFVADSITALNNGNYVVSSSNWSGARGAATWGNGNGGTVGIVSDGNSLVGSSSNDRVGSSDFGSSITALSNGNYVVVSSRWNNIFSSATLAGAATWGNGNTGITGFINSANSLIGSQFNDRVGNDGVTALTNGNYVVRSAGWNDGTLTALGAATWGNGATGISGIVSSANSLVGTNSFDWVSRSGVIALNNGNYVVGSNQWNNNRGAATWGNGLTGITGTINIANSLTGSSINDFVGGNDNIAGNGITALANGNYVVSSSVWNNGSLPGAGAVTWGNGLTGVTGLVSSSNSLVGSQANDNVGSNGIAALSNGNYVISSPNWNNGLIVNAGAATWGNGTTAISGTISSTNSLIGTTAGDFVSGNQINSDSFDTAVISFSSINGITALPDGNYVVNSVRWNNGTIANAGASTWGNGFTGSHGIVSTINSLTGSASFDWNNLHVIGMANGNYVLSSSVWDNNGLVDAGQVRIGTPGNIFFANGLGQTMTFHPANLADTLASGTNVILQASNDITLEAGTDILVSGNNGGSLTMQAGRNIILNSSIFTANGDFTAIAGDPAALPFDRDSGIPLITLGTGATINAGNGKVILAAIGGNFINNTGSTAPITASQWLIYSTDPTLNSRNGMPADFKHYAQPYTGSTPDYASIGNWFLYSITPVLTVMPLQTTIGDAISSGFSFTLAGFIDGDTTDTAGISGSAIFGINNFINKPGRYDVSYLTGLFSSLGYLFVDNTQSVDELIVEPETIVKPEKTIPEIIVEPEAIPEIIVESSPILTRVANLINQNLLLSQISSLQQSVVFLPVVTQDLDQDTDLLDIENEGIKLPAKLHKIISLFVCPTGLKNVP
jgi:filamentous hemagglutinin family protein